MRYSKPRSKADNTLHHYTLSHRQTILQQYLYFYNPIVCNLWFTESSFVKMDKGDGTHIGANQEICLRLEAIEDIAQDERHGAGMISRLHIVIINGLEDEGIALLRGIMDEEQPSDDDDDSIAVVNDDLDNGDEVLQEEDATAEPQVDMDANQPSEAEGSLSGGCRTRSREEDDDDEMSSKRFRCLTDAISDGDNDSDAEEDEAMSMPSSSSLPGGSRRRSWGEDRRASQ
ncbi:surface protein [Etheostoma spectabile]|uniref:surface protein n=1 Tax=Etheostoma spectabile TaxID=54343 RepID=UPI0013AEA4D4|nr:surface protein-like [Etheostoma spectabile]